MHQSGVFVQYPFGFKDKEKRFTDAENNRPSKNLDKKV